MALVDGLEPFEGDGFALAVVVGAGLLGLLPILVVVVVVVAVEVVAPAEVGTTILS